MTGAKTKEQKEADAIVLLAEENVRLKKLVKSIKGLCDEKWDLRDLILAAILDAEEEGLKLDTL